MTDGIPTGLFGGTFDPPTVAHLLIAEWVRDALALDCVWFMPAAVNPFKQDNITTPADIRLRMLRESCSGVNHFIVRDDEILRGGVSYTVDTLRRLNDEHPDRRITLILGGDSVHSLMRWKDPDEIIERADIAAVVRPGWKLEDADPKVRDHIRPVEIPELAVSATLVRQRVAEGKSVRFLVPQPALKIIHDLKLYR